MMLVAMKMLRVMERARAMAMEKIVKKRDPRKEMASLRKLKPLKRSSRISRIRNWMMSSLRSLRI